MRKWLLVVGFWLLAIFIWFYINKPALNKTGLPVIISSTPTPTPLNEKKQTIVIEYPPGKIQNISWFEVKDIIKLILIPNYQRKLAASDIVKNNSCINGINAGFYDRGNLPLGLVINEGTILSKTRSNNFFNGFFLINKDNSFTISDTLPNEALRLGIQSGPLLYLNGNQLNLKIIDDKNARRNVTLETGDKKLRFASIYHPDNDLDGPLLSDLPQILSLFAKKQGLEINNALNLDGGSASAFYGEGITLTEVTSVGAFLCVGNQSY